MIENECHNDYYGALQGFTMGQNDYYGVLLGFTTRYNGYYG